MPGKAEQIGTTVMRFAVRATMHEIGNPPLGRNIASRPSGGGDPMASARAAEAANAVQALYAGQIAAVMSDRNLTPEQRKAIVAALRAKAKVEAKFAAKCVMEAAKAATARAQCG